MNRLKAVFFLLIAPLFMIPAIVLAWYRFHEGLDITMPLFFEFWIWGGVAASISTIVRMTYFLLRGR